MGLLGLAAATLLFAVGAPFWLLLVARVLQGFAAGMSWVAGLSLIAAATPPETRGRSMGLAMSMVSVGVLVGPPLAGLLVHAFGTAAPFLLGAGMAVVDGVLRLALVRASPRSPDDFAGPVAVLRFRGTPSVLVVVLVGAATLAAIEPVLPPHLAATQHLGALGTGGLFALAVLTGAVLNPVIGALIGRVDARVLVGIGGAAAALGLGGIVVAQSVWQLAVAMAALGASNALLLAPATTVIGYQGMRASPPAFGAAYAAFNLAYAAGLFLGPLFSGAATGLTGFSVALAAVAVLALALIVAGLRRLPTGRQPGAAAPAAMQSAGGES